MKTILFIIIALFAGGQCYAQSQEPKTSDKTITTAVDTLVLSAQSLNRVTINITNRSATDTLLWKTENEVIYSKLFPGQRFHDVLYAKKIFRKASSGSGIFSQLKVN